jgi:hypothetical protein
MQTSHLAPKMHDRVRELTAERNELREVVRRQGEFIQSIKQQIRDFRDHPPLR